MRAEDVIQKSIVDFLARALPSDSYVFAIPNGTVLAGGKAKRARQSNMLKATGMAVGAPDIWILVRGQSIALEVKTATGRLEDAQKAASGQIFASGGLYSVVRSVDDAERYLRASGVQLRATVIQGHPPIAVAG